MIYRKLKLLKSCLSKVVCIWFFSFSSFLLSTQVYANSYQCSWDFQKIELPTISGCSSFIEKDGSAFFDGNCLIEIKEVLAGNIMLPLFNSLTSGPNKRVSASLVRKGSGNFSGWVSGIGDPYSGLVPEDMTKVVKLKGLVMLDGSVITGDYLAPIDKSLSRQMPEGWGYISIWPSVGRMRIDNSMGSIFFSGSCEVS